MEVKVKNKLLENEFFRIKRMKEVIKATNPHGHKDYLEMIFLTEGAGQHHIDYHQFSVKPYSLYFILPGQIHSWDLTEIPKGYVVMLQKDFLIDTPLYDRLFQKFPRPLESGYDVSSIQEEIGYLFQQIEKEYLAKDSHYLSIIQTYIQLLFTKLKRLENVPVNLVESKLIHHFFDLLNANYRDHKEVGSYADLLHVTGKTLNNTCRKFLNRTTSDVINEKIVVEAKKLLLYTDQNLTEITFELGFSDPSHFNKFFKRATGVLPGIYRKGIS
tara:strand:+ start:274 stop:1089 length:816 start_codon:yes stop_codon:yes gene_type:complete